MTTNDYRFRIDSAFYDRLHDRVNQVRVKENESRPGKGWGFKLLTTDPAELPTREHLADIIDTSFWASLGKEEGQPIRFKIGYKPKPITYNGGITFVRPLEFSVSSIVKLAPSCGDDGALLIASTDKGLEIFGREDSGISFFEVKVIDPGQLVIKAGTWNIAAISGSEVIFIRDGYLGHFGEMWNKLGDWTIDEDDSDVNSQVNTRRTILINVARRMRSRGHGGAVIITPNDESWRRCVSEIVYESESQKGALRVALDLLAHFAKDNHSRNVVYFTAVESAINDLVALTQVDGAVLLRPDFSLIGFGAKLKPADQTVSSAIYESDPLDHSDSHIFREARSIIGTRHSSAARFVQDNPDALALVVSQDGIVSCFATRLFNGIESIVRYKRLELTLI